MSECYYCTKPGAEKIRIGVDADTGDDGSTYGIYSDEWLCIDHLEQYEQGEGVFDPYKYQDR
jgi:hypothetical protein